MQLFAYQGKGGVSQVFVHMLPCRYMATGRPSEFTQEIAERICAELALGKSLRTVCKGEDMPAIATIFNWFRTQEGFVEQYARAKEESSDALVEEMLDIADDAPLKVTGMDKSDSARVHAEAMRVDTRKWIASKLKPKKYGDRLDLTTKGEKLPTPIYGGQSVTPKDV